MFVTFLISIIEMGDGVRLVYNVFFPSAGTSYKVTGQTRPYRLKNNNKL